MVLIALVMTRCPCDGEAISTEEPILTAVEQRARFFGQVWPSGGDSRKSEVWWKSKET